MTAIIGQNRVTRYTAAAVTSPTGAVPVCTSTKPTPTTIASARFSGTFRPITRRRTRRMTRMFSSAAVSESTATCRVSRRSMP